MVDPSHVSEKIFWFESETDQSVMQEEEQMEYRSNFQEEEKLLDHVLVLIRDRIPLMEEEIKKTEEYLEFLYAMEVDPYSPYRHEIPGMEEHHQYYAKSLLHMKKAASNPYFGKIYFSYEGEKQDHLYYIGKRNISDLTFTNGEPMQIIDWRAPVSAVYYDGRLGKTNFDGPYETMYVDLKGKTTIKIKDGKLVNLYDVEVVTNDELLADYLSQNKDTVLNDIITVCQGAQKKKKKKKLSQNIIVQGVAGSGKTTVALHRISYLLYNYEKEITYENVCLIAANPLFLHYITSMLPDLDVPAVQQGTMQEILTNGIAQYQPHFSRKITEGVFQTVYSNETYPKQIQNFLDEIQQQVFRENRIRLLTVELVSAEQITVILRKKSMSLFEKAKELDKIMDHSLKRCRGELISIITDYKENETVKKIAKDILKLDPNHILEFNVESNYGRLTKFFKNYFSRRLKQLRVQELFSEFTGLSKIETVNDLACYLYLLYQVKGPKQEFDKTKQIVIDEAQDFNIAVYLCLRAIYSKATFTIVGDVMQNIHEDGLHSWEPVLEEAFDGKAECIKLLKSYRNTIEISAFAQKIMEYVTQKPFYIEPIIRHGKAPQIYSYQSDEDKIKRIQSELIPSFQAEDRKLNAIICKTMENAQKAAHALRETEHVILMDTEQEHLEFGTYIVTVGSSKGLEFDAVILWDFDLYDIQTDSLDYKLLYVAMTRALHELHIFSNREEIGKIAKELFE